MRLDMMLMGWFVLEFTDSPLLVAFIYGIRVVPMIFLGAISGVIADRLNRRNILIITRLGFMIVDVVLGFVIATGVIQYSHFILLILVWGVFNTFNNTTNSSFIPDLVGREDTMNAVGLQNVCMTVMGIVGSPIWGLLINGVGVSWCYYFSAVLYGLQAIMFLMMRGVKQPFPQKRESPIRSLVDGLKYVRSVQTLLAANFVAFLWNLLTVPFISGFMSVYARDILDVGAVGLGMLNMAASIGRTVGSLVVTNLGSFKRKGLLLLTSTGIQPVFLLLFSFSRYYPLSLLLMAGAGVAAGLWNATSQTLLLTVSSEEMRGRTMGVRMQAITGEPIGYYWSGMAAESIGVLPALWIGNSIYALLIIFVAILAPKLRKVS
jgi:MFS family permease